MGKLDRRIGEKLKLLSSSYYVRYMEAKLDDMDVEMEKIKQENRILRGDLTDVPTNVKVVGEDELVTHLETNWEIVTPLSDKRFVVRRVRGL